MSDLILSLQTITSVLVVSPSLTSTLSDLLMTIYTMSSLFLSLSIPADKAISLACPFQYHNIVTRSADLTCIPSLQNMSQLITIAGAIF